MSFVFILYEILILRPYLKERGSEMFLFFTNLKLKNNLAIKEATCKLK